MVEFLAVTNAVTGKANLVATCCIHSTDRGFFVHRLERREKKREKRESESKNGKHATNHGNDTTLWNADLLHEHHCRRISLRSEQRSTARRNSTTTTKNVHSARTKHTGFNNRARPDHRNIYTHSHTHSHTQNANTR